MSGRLLLVILIQPKAGRGALRRDPRSAGSGGKRRQMLMKGSKYPVKQVSKRGAYSNVSSIPSGGVNVLLAKVRTSVPWWDISR